MFTFEKVQNPHIYLFGAGGTGGFALEYLTRLFANSEQRVTIDIYDGDTVELKNLKRQNFTTDDLDLNKATALVKRMQKQVPTPPKLNVHTEYITDEDELTADILMSTEDDETAIIVSAVDNISTRRLINSVIEDLTDSLSIIGIDSGNDDQGGQVVIFGKAEQKDILGEANQIVLPNMLKLFPEIDIIKDERDENPGIVSVCAEESEAKPQAMMANVRNGELIANLVYQVSQNEPIAYNVWKSSIMGNTTGTQKV